MIRKMTCRRLVRGEMLTASGLQLHVNKALTMLEMRLRTTQNEHHGTAGNWGSYTWPVDVLSCQDRYNWESRVVFLPAFLDADTLLSSIYELQDPQHKWFREGRCMFKESTEGLVQKFFETDSHTIALVLVREWPYVGFSGLLDSLGNIRTGHWEK